jgi:hypothetical protein
MSVLRLRVILVARIVLTILPTRIVATFELVPATCISNQPTASNPDTRNQYTYRQPVPGLHPPPHLQWSRWWHIPGG